MQSCANAQLLAATRCDRDSDLGTEAYDATPPTAPTPIRTKSSSEAGHRMFGISIRMISATELATAPGQVPATQPTGFPPIRLVEMQTNAVPLDASEIRNTY
jgi:hypothetical protein